MRRVGSYRLFHNRRSYWTINGRRSQNSLSLQLFRAGVAFKALPGRVLVVSVAKDSPSHGASAWKTFELEGSSHHLEDIGKAVE